MEGELTLTHAQTVHLCHLCTAGSAVLANVPVLTVDRPWERDTVTKCLASEGALLLGPKTHATEEDRCCKDEKSNVHRTLSLESQ